ncbi:MAG: FHA domain-containing protein [Gemmatimonadaceae bacterium]|nr:FHA domain-containing protein [Gemmatimonadaceae bacterium]
MRRIILTDLDRGTVHEFRDADVRIGRDAACELQIAEAPASADIGGVHARLAPRPTGWCLTDERSAGGTFVNHVRLVGNDQAILRTGDVLRLGSGAGARRFRVARVESAMAPKQAPAVAAGAPAATATIRQEASDLRLAAGAVGGAVAATAAAVPRATNAQLAAGAAAGTAVASAGVAAASGLAAKGKGAKGPNGRQTSSAALTGAAAAGAVAATGGVAGVAAVGGGTEAWRASTIFRAAGDTASIAPKAGAASLWAGVVAGTVLVTATATGIAAARGSGGTANRAPVAATAGQVGGASAAAPGGNASDGDASESDASDTAEPTSESRPAADAPKSASRLAATASAVGNILADVEGWRGGTRVRLTGLVVGEGGIVVTSDALGASGRLDSIVARSPYGGPHAGKLVARSGGVSVLSVPSWDGQWLGPSAVGSATTIPTWSAVVGYDRLTTKSMLSAAEGAAAMTSTAIEVRGVSDRLLPGAALVSDDGRVVGLWLGDGRAMPMQQVLAAARGAGQRAR